MGSTSIEWTEVTWNPVRGCTRISPGCQNCYAEVMAARFSDPGYWGEGFAKRTDHGGRWTGKVELIPEKLAEPLSWRKPRMCFVNSMSDLFHERLTNQEIAAVYGIMAATPPMTYQVLTKRPERRLEFHGWVSNQGQYGGAPAGPGEVCACIAIDYFAAPIPITGPPLLPSWPPLNVWEGVSVENRDCKWRIDILRQTPAALRFLSLEPLLEDLDELNLDGISWVIVGGESGHGARPCDLAWIRSIVEQCREAGVPCFVKQLGEEWARDKFTAGKSVFAWGDHKGGEPKHWPERFPREMPPPPPIAPEGTISGSTQAEEGGA